MTVFDVDKIEINKIDTIFEKWQIINNVRLIDHQILKIKNEILTAIEFIKNNKNNNSIMDFYYSEYPMGAIHSKSIRRKNTEWFLEQYDYDKKPQLKSVMLSSDSFIEDFITFAYKWD